VRSFTFEHSINDRNEYGRMTFLGVIDPTNLLGWIKEALICRVSFYEIVAKSVLLRKNFLASPIVFTPDDIPTSS